MRRSRWMVSALPIAVVLTLAAGTISPAWAQEVRLEAELIATNADPLASGKAKFESRADRTRFSTEAQDVSTDRMGLVTVTRPGVGIIQSNNITIAGGVGDLNLDTRDGDIVVAMQTGDTVQVFDSAGNLILTGTLAPK
ncbi:MAG: hypothetical protein ACE5JQ_15280 [Candidatus Methylomirabilales bacterium]